MKVKVNPIFTIVLLYGYVTGTLNTFILFFLMLFIHDFAHFLAVRYYDVTVFSIEIMPFGCEMNIDDESVQDSEKLFIYALGPIVNILIAMLLFIAKYTGIYTFPLYDDMIFANLCIGIFNLLPLHPLDGSVVLRIYLSKLLGDIRASKVIIFMTQIVALFLLSLTVYSFTYGIYNINFGLIGGFLLFQSIKEKEATLVKAVKRELNKRQRVHSSGKYVKSERICVSINAGLKNIMSHFDGNKYYIIEVIDMDHRYITTITEEDVLEGIMLFGYDCTIKDILV